MLSPPAWPYSITQTSSWSTSHYMRSSIRIPITEALSNLETSKSNFQCQENFGKGLNLENSACFVFQTISNHKMRIVLYKIWTHARASLFGAECSLLSICYLVSSRNALSFPEKRLKNGCDLLRFSLYKTRGVFIGLKIFIENYV